MAIGLVYSTFATAIIFFLSMELITGYRKRPSNTYFWEVIIQYSPRTTSYDPNMPSLYIWDSIRGLIIMACKTFVDEFRSIEATQ